MSQSKILKYNQPILDAPIWLDTSMHTSKQI